MAGNANFLPSLLDEVFDLPVDWEFSKDEREISLEVLAEFSRLSMAIASHTADSDYHAAISFIWSVRKYVGIRKYNDSDFVGTTISAEQSQRIMEILQYSEKHARNIFDPEDTSGPTLTSLLLHKDREKIFELFLQKERLILRNWGLNQQSVEIIVDRLRRYEFRVFINILEGGSLRSDAVLHSCLALQTLAKVPVAARSPGKKGQLARSSHRSNLVRAKDKIIGIATLFGDVAPLVWGQDLGVASWMSTSTGATAMALLPRGSVSN